MTANLEPDLKEILTSDMAFAFMSYVYNAIQIPTNNLSAVWNRLRWDPWYSIPVYRDIEEKDDAVSSALETRKDGVLAKKRRCLPASDKPRDKKVAAFIEETLEAYFDPLQSTMGIRFGLDSTLYEMLDAVGKGVSVGEIIWGNSPDRVCIQAVKFKPQHLFAFGEGNIGGAWTASYLLPQDGPLRVRPGLLLPNIPPDGLLPERKFVVHTYRPQYSNRWGTPLDRRCFWLSSFKRGAVKAWLRFLEKGSGSVVAKWRDGATDEEKQAALDAALKINEEAAAATSESTMVEVMEPPGGAGLQRDG